MRWKRSRNDPSLENKLKGFDFGLLGAREADEPAAAGVLGAGDGDGEAAVELDDI